MLFHISENSGITTFEPRLSEYTSEPVVWAINEERLCNYLVPRDCPRVTFYAGIGTHNADVEQFLGSSRAVVAIESKWLTKVSEWSLYCYHLQTESFELLDESAGYFVSHKAVVPSSVEVVNDLPTELQRRGAELRVLPELWALHDQISDSTLEYSMIRMRNAMPRK